MNKRDLGVERVEGSSGPDITVESSAIYPTGLVNGFVNTTPQHGTSPRPTGPDVEVEELP